MIKTNEDRLLVFAVIGEVAHPRLIVDRGYTTTWDGKPKISLGLGGIKYNLKVGDSCFGWASADHAEPGVAIKDVPPTVPPTERTREAPLLPLTCIGNEAVIITGEGKGAKGIVTGKHGRQNHVLVYFKGEYIEKLAIGDKIQVKAKGTGLKIEGFDEVRVISCSPKLLKAMKVEENEGKMEIPVVMEVPAYIIGLGHGGWPAEASNWDIQTCYPEAVKELDLERLRIGDLVALKDEQCFWGLGYYKGAITVGIVSYGASDLAGNGVGITPLFSSREGNIRPRIDPDANIVYYLDLREN